MFNALDSLLDEGEASARDPLRPTAPAGKLPDGVHTVSLAGLEAPAIGERFASPAPSIDSPAEWPAKAWPASWSMDSPTLPPDLTSLGTAASDEADVDTDVATGVANTPAPNEETFSPPFNPFFVEKTSDPRGDRLDRTATAGPTFDNRTPPGWNQVDATAGDPIVQRDASEFPTYSKWPDAIAAPASALPAEPTLRWTLITVAAFLALLLAGQAVFHWRTEIAAATPALRPLLLLFSRVFNADLPLPRRVDLVSIDASDLQIDPARNNLLVLSTTLRNRATFAQPYPALELSLTDTADNAIVRRVFRPAEYLPPRIVAAQPFAANAEVAIRLWIEARDVGAAGYRLYVFYP
ncbi:MAG: DUF3426 domain-containing protein [Propionivibrio sp.]